MELDDLSSRKSTLHIDSPKDAPEHPPQRGKTIENPPDETLHNLAFSEQLPSTQSNIIAAHRNTTNSILQFSHVLILQRWWSRHISLVVVHTSDAPTGGDPRDYLSLERTFLAYVRTASALVSFGIIITQLFVLKKVNPRTGSIFGAIMSAGGIAVTLIGCLRYFKQQKYLTHGKAISAGWDIVILWILVFAITISMFVVLLVQD